MKANLLISLQMLLRPQVPGYQAGAAGARARGVPQPRGGGGGGGRPGPGQPRGASEAG